jgi:hypothetical protein
MKVLRKLKILKVKLKIPIQGIKKAILINGQESQFYADITTEY